MIVEFVVKIGRKNGISWIYDFIPLHVAVFTRAFAIFGIE